MTATGADQEAAGQTTRGYWWWERRRSVALDVGLALLSALECVLEGVEFAGDTGLPVPLAVLFGLAAGSVLVLRRRWPIAVVLVSIATTPAEMGYLMGIVGLYTLAASEVPRRITVVLTGMTLVGTFIVTYVRLRQSMDAHADFGPGFWYVPVVSLFMSLGLTAPSVLFGLYIGARRRLMESLRERADSLERELSLLADRAEERAEWARTEERTRIAREMHDVVAHRVSLMVVHAAALQAVAPKDPAKAVRNAALVGDMGRQALTELREMLGVLRSGDALVAPRSGLVPLASVGRVAAEVAEVVAEDGPRLCEVEALVAQSRDAGMTVELSVEGELRPYAPVVEQTAYRVVQEALTNVHKHAAGARTWVRLAHRGSEVAMQVENGPSDGVTADAGLPSGGNGLVGMRERVLGLGGVFVSGPTDAGGFRVSAVLPDGGAAGV
ncbi:sensor histidine kinase [Streptomyces sp. NBC_00059]|uniref:sensor histidine kinase n=1 Tax=Streptomyces sp. NBC_00059 TaxID=2975635 RepID=UPI00225022AE|nr:histidine kinase [Streptomyces sp. NBC_00059]MCX5412038.1 histidine kinase [Streptomyces sp. NBC_00059]